MPPGAAPAPDGEAVGGEVGEVAQARTHHSQHQLTGLAGAGLKLFLKAYNSNLKVQEIEERNEKKKNSCHEGFNCNRKALFAMPFIKPHNCSLSQLLASVL